MEGEGFVVDELLESEEFFKFFGVDPNEYIFATQGASTDPDAMPDASFLYITFGSSDDAIKFFNARVDNMEMAIEGLGLDVTPTVENSDNYSKWTAKGDVWSEGFNSYECYIRLENTILLVSKNYNLESDIEPIDAIVSKLGYLSNTNFR